MSGYQYWLRLIRLFYHYRKKSIRLPYLPVRIWIEMTSECNFACVMCPNKDLKKTDIGSMDLSLFQKIIDEAAHFVFEINLAHRGESLLHPQITEAVSYAKKKQLFTRLHTNGSLLTKSLAEKLIEAGLDKISFSFDGFDKITYEKIRRGGDFDLTIKNIVQFLELKKERKSKTPVTAIEVINFSQTSRTDQEADKQVFLKKFEHLPLDSLEFKDLHNWAGQIHTQSKKENYSICPFPWNALVFCWNGDVIPCTQDFFNSFTAGNVNHNTIAEIWNNTSMQTLRKKLASQNIRDLQACSGCDRVWRKGLFGIPKEYLWKFITKKMP